jgi:hypothetical protein
MKYQSHQWIQNALALIYEVQLKILNKLNFYLDKYKIFVGIMFGISPVGLAQNACVT